MATNKYSLIGSTLNSKDSHGVKAFYSLKDAKSYLKANKDVKGHAVFGFNRFGLFAMIANADESAVLCNDGSWRGLPAQDLTGVIKNHVSSLFSLW